VEKCNLRTIENQCIAFIATDENIFGIWFYNRQMIKEMKQIKSELLNTVGGFEVRLTRFGQVPRSTGLFSDFKAQ